MSPLVLVLLLLAGAAGAQEPPPFEPWITWRMAPRPAAEKCQLVTDDVVTAELPLAHAVRLARGRWTMRLPPQPTGARLFVVCWNRAGGSAPLSNAVVMPPRGHRARPRRAEDQTERVVYEGVPGQGAPRRAVVLGIDWRAP